MSDQAWAIEQMQKHRLQIDFGRGTIDCRGYNAGWYWGLSSIHKTFYEALAAAVKDIRKHS